MRLGQLCSRIGTPLLFASLFATTALATQPSWQAIGQVGGPTQGVAVQGHYAYVGVGLRLVILDISNPADMREVGVTPPFPHFVEDVAISGTLAYVAAGGSGLRVVDISNPALPTEVGAWDSRGYANGVAVAGSIAYLADGPYGLRVLDVAAPSQPVEVGSAYPTNYAFKVVVQGGVAYVAAAAAGVLIADVTDPRHPVEVGSLITGGYAYGVAVAGGSAYVADGWEGLKVVSVTNPVQPVLTGACKTPGWAFGVAVAGSRAYVADAIGGLRVIDVADASHPVEVARSEMPDGNAANVTVADGVAYVTDRFAGLHSVSLSGAANLPRVGSYRSLPYADAVAVAGNRAYVATSLGLAVVDVSNPARPRQLGDLDLGGYATSVSVSGQWACVAMGAGGGGNGLRMVDVSDPAHPSSVATHSRPPGAYRDMVVSEGIAYGANEWGLEIVRVSDPLHPEWLGFLQMHGGADTVIGVAVNGTTAYVAADPGSLEVVDVSDPRHPVWKGAYGSILAQDVVVAGKWAYVAGFDFVVVDVADPARPTGTGFLTTPGQAYGVAIAGNLAYVADGDKGLTVVDVSDPYRPLLAGTFDTVGFSHEVVPADGRVYVADGIGGLLILEKTAAAGSSAAKPSAGESETNRPPAVLGYIPRPPATNLVTSGTGAVAPRTRGSGKLSTRSLVTSAADAGTGTLRACLADAPSGTVITFDPIAFPSSNPTTIHLGSALPGLTSGSVTIDGSNAGVILDGSAISQSSTPGLLHLQSDGNTVRGLQILRSPNSGIEIDGSDNRIGGDRTKGEGNVISGNGRHAIAINGSSRGASNNTVVGNLVGTDATGTKPLGNAQDAVFLSGGASNNTIGGLDPGERNVISGNGGSGVTAAGRATRGNVVVGNYVGTDVTGTVAIPNAGSGVSIEGGGSNNRIEGNLLSGNQGSGISLGDWNSCYNAVVGNRIGTDSTGTKALANGSGVFLGFMGGSFNRIGGLRPEERNIISGNRQGIVVQGPAAMGNLVLGNFIGTDITGSRALGNEGVGVTLTSDSRSIVGGATLREANVISASGAEGVGVWSDDNVVAGNYIGTDSSGEMAMGNRWWWAVRVLGAHNVIQRNVIANSESGVLLDVSSRTPVRRNSIHTNKGKGILYTAADVPIAPPVITRVDSMAVSGTACPGCEVEIFSDSEDEGRVFEGSVVAGAQGSFTLALQRFLIGPNVTATATDAQGNTSAFSAAHAAPSRPPRHRAVRP